MRQWSVPVSLLILLVPHYSVLSQAPPIQLPIDVSHFTQMIHAQINQHSLSVPAGETANAFFNDTRLNPVDVLRGISENVQTFPDLQTVGNMALVVLRSSSGEIFSLTGGHTSGVRVPLQITYRFSSQNQDVLSLFSKRPQTISAEKFFTVQDILSEPPPEVPDELVSPAAKQLPTFLEVQFNWCWPDVSKEDWKHQPSPCPEIKKGDEVPKDYPLAFCPPLGKGPNGGSLMRPCTVNAIYIKDLSSTMSKYDLVPVKVIIPAFVLSEKEMLASEALVQKISSDPSFPIIMVNDVDVRELVGPYKQALEERDPNDSTWDSTYVARGGWSSVRNYRFALYPPNTTCKPPSRDAVSAQVIDAVRPPNSVEPLTRDNGIVANTPKIYDVFTLRQMLAQTASQLAALTGFSGTNVTSAFGNLQGTVASSSNFGVQATITPSTPATVSTGSTGGGTPATASLPAPTLPNNIGVSASDILTEQVQLNSQITSLQLALQGALSDQFVVNAGRATNSRQQTTLGFNISVDPPRRYRHAVAEIKVWVFPQRQEDEVSIVNLLPAAKTYNVAKLTSRQNQFGANVAVDIVNLGASAARAKNRLYLAKDTDTLALRYDVDSNEPDADRWPDRGRHYRGSAWYQNHIAPDTWSNGAHPIGRSPEEFFSDLVPTVEAWQLVQNACDQDPAPYLLPEAPRGALRPLVFGWQFRPVLGADYVQPGIHSVLAQLALPVGLGAQYSPRIFIQTRWRAYDENKQVVGGVYAGSCSIEEDLQPIQVVGPLRVEDVQVQDMTGGILKVQAKGRFLANSFSVLSGQTVITPTTLGGKSIQFFGSAETLLANDDLSLQAEDGRLIEMLIKPDQPALTKDCGLDSATLKATPRPDGNSLVEAKITSGPRYHISEDGRPNPLFLIGTQVYGLHETPYLSTDGEDCEDPPDRGFTCVYHFLAPTDALRAAQSYTVRDLAREGMIKRGKIQFEPSFSALSLIASNQTAPANLTPVVAVPAKMPGKAATTSSTPDPNAGSSKESLNSAKKAPTPLPSVYALTGNDLLNIPMPTLNCDQEHGLPCLEAYQGLTQIPLSAHNFQRMSQTYAVITVPPPLPAPLVNVNDVCTTETLPAAQKPRATGSTASPNPPQTQRASAPTPSSSIAARQEKPTTTQTKCSPAISITDGDANATIFFVEEGVDPDLGLNNPTTKIYKAPFPVAIPAGRRVEVLSALAKSSDGTESSLTRVEIVQGSGTGTTKNYAVYPTTTETSSQLIYKTYRFVWHPTYGDPIEWELPIPTPTAPTVTASIVLNVSDSTDVTFSNVQILPSTAANPVTFTFDGAVLNPTPTFTYDPVAMTIKVLITSNMTLKPGHKVLLLNGFTQAPGVSSLTAAHIELPFDVTKR
jgi:hypothetical protein